MGPRSRSLELLLAMLRGVLPGLVRLEMRDGGPELWGGLRCVGASARGGLVAGLLGLQMRDGDLKLWGGP